jgi:rhombotail lipoprotein
VSAVVLCLLAVLSAGCTPRTARRGANVLDYLYPEGKVQASADEVRLSLPLRVGVSFAPANGKSPEADVFSEPQKREILTRVAEAFRGTPDVSFVEILPTHNLVAKGGFENLRQIAGMYGVNLVALVSYDQIQFDDQDFSSLLYMTIVGLYLVPADRLETHTLLDASVFEVESRALLFTGSGSSIVKTRATAVDASRELRSDSVAGFEQATADMIANLKITLGVFRENAKKGTVRGIGTPRVQIQTAESSTRAGGSGAGAFGFAELLGVALLALAARFALAARARRAPVLTLAFVVLALLSSFGPASSWLRDALELERDALLRGELWRALTGHLVHGWPALAFFDLGAIAILGAWIEQRSRGELAIAMTLAVLISSSALLAFRPDLALYQGSSAIACALFVVCAIDLLRGPQTRLGARIARLALIGFAAKLALEGMGLWAGPSFQESGAVESVALAHVAGALAGAFVSAGGRWTSRGAGRGSRSGCAAASPRFAAAGARAAGTCSA